MQPYTIGHDNIEDVLNGAGWYRLATLLEAEAHAKEGTTVNEPRYAVIVTSNAYEDREGEIVKEKALGEYVEAQWRGDTFVGQQPLLVWHGGDPIGNIVYAEMYGPFLVEVAKELPDGPVDLSRNGDAPYVSTVKAVWDALETANEELGASHEFLYAVKDREDRVYERIVKLETSALPRSGAGNGYTFFSVVRPATGTQE